MPTTTAAKPSPLPAAAGKSSRASWAGTISLGPLSIPVKAYPALVAPSAGPLRQVHLNCGQRINQRKVCLTHGEVATAEIGKAFEYGPDDHLLLTNDELQELTPPDDHTIRVEALLPADLFQFALLSGRTMYLIAAHTAAMPDFSRAVLALNDRNTWAIGSMVLSDARRPIALQSDGCRLLLYVLHFPEYRRACPSIPDEPVKASAQEVRTLEKTLQPLYKSFSWEQFRDEGAIRLSALIAAKIAKRKPTHGKTNRLAANRAKVSAVSNPARKRPQRAA